MVHRTLPAVDLVLARCVEGELFEGTPCWVVTRGLDSDGYGLIVDDDGVQTGTHRVTYKHFVGPIPPGLELDHRCRVRACANPWHAEAVTHAVNMERAAPEVCKRGHRDWVAFPSGGRGGKAMRRCRTCQREHDRAYKARKRATFPRAREGVSLSSQPGMVGIT